MNTGTQILPGIRRIGWVESRHLPKSVPLQAVCGNKVPVLATVRWIEFFGDPDCRCTTEKLRGLVSQSSTLRFSTCQPIPVSQTLSFVVEDVNGAFFLIGQAEPPFPKIKFERMCGSPKADAAGFSFEVTHNSLRTMVRCAVF